MAESKVVRDERQAADAREWLAAEEDETAMTPERMAALEAAGADAEAPVPLAVVAACAKLARRRAVGGRRFAAFAVGRAAPVL